MLGNISDLLSLWSCGSPYQLGALCSMITCNARHRRTPRLSGLGEQLSIWVYLLTGQHQPARPSSVRVRGQQQGWQRRCTHFTLYWLTIKFPMPIFILICMYRNICARVYVCGELGARWYMCRTGDKRASIYIYTRMHIYICLPDCCHYERTKHTKTVLIHCIFIYFHAEILHRAWFGLTRNAGVTNHSS